MYDESATTTSRNICWPTRWKCCVCHIKHNGPLCWCIVDFTLFCFFRFAHYSMELCWVVVLKNNVIGISQNFRFQLLFLISFLPKSSIRRMQALANVWLYASMCSTFCHRFIFVFLIILIERKKIKGNFHKHSCLLCLMSILRSLLGLQ